MHRLLTVLGKVNSGLSRVREIRKLSSLAPNNTSISTESSRAFFQSEEERIASKNSCCSRLETTTHHPFFARTS